MFQVDYTARTRKLTPAQRKAEQIARLEYLQARRERAMADPINADAPRSRWEQMTRPPLHDGAKLNQLKGLPAFG